MTFRQENTTLEALMVYLGAEPWIAPRSLCDMFRKTDKRITSLISDYKIHMVIPQELDDFSKFRKHWEKCWRSSKYQKIKLQ